MQAEAPGIDRGTRVAAGLTFLCIFAVAVYVILYYAGAEAVRSAWVNYLLAVPAAGTCVGVAIFLRRGSGRAHRGALWGGWLAMAAGMVVDVVATVVHTPDLSLEGNPVIRSLLDAGHSVEFVYVAGGLGQAAYMFSSCGLWWSLLRHRSLWLSTSMATRPGSPAAFFKATWGGGELTWRQWFFPLRYSEFPSFFHVLCALGTMTVAAPLFRVYYGLNWMGWVPDCHPLAAIGATVALYVPVYALYLRGEFARLRGDNLASGEGVGV